MTEDQQATENVLDVRALRKEYGGRRRSDDVVAVADLSFSLVRGESVAIVGESGSGKTTLAKMLMGMTAPTSGQILFNGTEVTGHRLNARGRRHRARYIQMVFQDPYSSLDPRQRVGQCLREAIRIHFSLDSAAITARVNELLAAVGLDAAIADSYPHALSGGQRQRIAIARALAARPSVLVLDEAVSALDVSVQKQVLDLLHTIRREESMSYIFISHDLAVVHEISDRILVMRAGEVVESGDTATVLESPQHPYTQLLRACAPGPGWDPAAALTAITKARATP